MASWRKMTGAQKWGRLADIMKCAKLHLLERSRPRKKLDVNLDKPRRYCQKRMVNPEHDEDPRWNDLPEKGFYCNTSDERRNLNGSVRVQQEVGDLFLSVQNLQFKGDVQHRKRPRTNFKYKTVNDGKQHRMFVKQAVTYEIDEPDRFSELTCYYFDDYVNFFLSGNDRSRPSSAKSTIVLTNATDKNKENKSIQVDITQAKDARKMRRYETKVKMSPKTNVKQEHNDEIKKELDQNNVEDTKISFKKRGKRKSLTISRTESPATIQIIRVDVVCNYSCSSTMSDYEDKKQTSNNGREEEMEKNKETIKVKNTRFANKYLLTKTVKTLDENVSGGSKVTLLCKTFRLADRSKFISRRKSSKSVKDVPNTNEKFQK